MRFLEKIITSISNCFGTLVGLNSASWKDFLVGGLSIAAIMAIWGISFELLYKFKKSKIGICNILAIAITLGIVALFVVICLIVDH